MLNRKPIQLLDDATQLSGTELIPVTQSGELRKISVGDLAAIAASLVPAAAQGPEGPRGLPGAAGAAGPEGPAGPVAPALVSTVEQLPPPASLGAGARAFVTDAASGVFLSVVTGGGAYRVPVVSDGVVWLVG